MGAEPPGLQAEWAAAHWQAKSFLHMMLQCEDENQMLSGLGPGAISFDANLPQARMHALPDAGLAVVTSLHDRFWFIVKHHAPKPKDVAKEVLLLSLRSEAANVSKDVAVMFHTRKASWEAALLVLHRVSLPDLAEQGVVSVCCSALLPKDTRVRAKPLLWI
eukprot:s4217_g2.t1